MADSPNVNAPASGSYGEQTALANLKKALPQGAIGNPAPPGGPQGGPGGGMKPPMVSPLPPGRPDTGGAAPPPGIPAVLMGPTQQPGTPVNTPLQGPVQGPGANGPDQARLQFLYSLASSPQVSPVTREWAQVLISHLVAPGTSYDLTQQPQFQGPPPPEAQADLAPAMGPSTPAPAG